MRCTSKGTKKSAYASICVHRGRMGQWVVNTGLTDLPREVVLRQLRL